MVEQLEQLELERKAALWDSFVSLGRIRILGSAKLGEPSYQHIGMELWTMYGVPADNYYFTETNTEAIKQMETFLTAWNKSNV